MITRKELQEIARLKQLSLGNVEKDYLLDIALSSITRNIKNELVFKGGTCLYKFHKMDRFSEDMDFSAVQEINIHKLVHNLISDFERFGIKAFQHEKKEPYNSVLITIRVEGPLFTGNPQSYAKLGIDINLKSPVIMQTEVLSYNPIYQEIPPVHVLCMKLEEILAEKIRAISTRNYARDLYDMFFLLKKDIHLDLGLINQKLAYYGKAFEKKEFIKKLNEKKKMWKTELSPLIIGELPGFNEARKHILGFF